MTKSLKWLLSVLVFTQLLTLYWVYEVRDGLKDYQRLEDNDKKNQIHLNGAFQKKLVDLDKRLLTLESERPPS